jgi:predicted Zn-dependent protease
VKILILTVLDVSVIDDYRDDVTWAEQCINLGILGYIALNNYYLDQYANAGQSSKIKNVIIHEFGHALGLDHNTASDVMYEYVTTNTVLSANDKASYDAAYLRY